jgi:hypothetical protein
MGEWSKKVGEVGESVAGEFLRMIGWSAAKHGVELPCARPEAHKTSGAERRTHGIDFLIAYPSPLFDGVGHNLVVSVKYSAEPYPQSPVRNFKEHFIDLAHTLECFKNSPERQSLTHGLRGVNRAHDIGVLLWFSNDRGPTRDVFSDVSSVVLPKTLSFEAVYLVDNKRAEFIFDTISYAHRLEKDCEVTFFYHDTGKNVNPQSRLKSGPLLPVEFVNASVLALRLDDKIAGRRVLMLSTVDLFSETGLKRLMGLAQALSQGWCSKAVLAFPDYDRLAHANVVQAAKMCFSDTGFAEHVEVHCYEADFRTVGI